MKRKVILVCAIIGIFIPASAQAAEIKPVCWKNFLGACEKTPESMAVFSGTGSGTFSVSGKTDWRKWGEGQTHVTGIASIKTCRPSCAEGGLMDRKARIVFSHIRSDLCGQRRYMNVWIKIYDKPRTWIFGPWGSDCRGAQIVRPYPHKPKPKRVKVRVCGLLQGEAGAYNYLKAWGIRCRKGWPISRKVRRKFCSRKNNCAFDPFTTSGITRTYRGRVKRNGWKCSVVVKWEFFRTVCEKGDMKLRNEGGA